MLKTMKGRKSVNRIQRRRENKAKPAYLRQSPEQVAKRIVQNGITMKDLEDNFNLGYKKGFNAAGQPIVKACFAAICLSLNELYGFGTKRCCDVLSRVDQHLLTTLSSEEAIAEVWDRIGLKLEFSEAFDRISMK